MILGLSAINDSRAVITDVDVVLANGHGQPTSYPDCMYVGRYHATALNVLAPPNVTYRKAGRLFCGFHAPITPLEYI